MSGQKAAFCWTWEYWGMNWQRALAAQKTNHTLDCIKRRVASRSKEEILSLYSALMRSHSKHCVQLWGPQLKKGMGLLEQVTGKVKKMIFRGMYWTCKRDSLSFVHCLLRILLPSFCRSCCHSNCQIAIQRPKSKCHSKAKGKAEQSLKGNKKRGHAQKTCLCTICRPEMHKLHRIQIYPYSCRPWMCQCKCNIKPQG